MGVDTLNESERTEEQILKDARALGRDGRAEEALTLLRDALRRGQLSAEGLEKAGRNIAKLLEQSGQKCSQLLLLGQCTSTWLNATLTACAWAAGTALRVRDGQYDNVVQELMAAQAAPVKPDIVVLLPWNRRLLGGDGNSAQKIEDEVAFWKQAWEIVTKNQGHG